MITTIQDLITDPRTKARVVWGTKWLQYLDGAFRVYDDNEEEVGQETDSETEAVRRLIEAGGEDEDITIYDLITSHGGRVVWGGNWLQYYAQDGVFRVYDVGDDNYLTDRQTDSETEAVRWLIEAGGLIE